MVLKMSVRALKWLVLGAIVTATMSALVSQSALAEQAGGQSAPSLELLEYLGMLIEDDGEYVGPTDFEESLIKQDAVFDFDQDMVIEDRVIDEEPDHD